MKKHFLFSLSFFLTITQIAYSQPAANAGLDLANYQRKGVRIGTPKLSDPNWCYMWKATPADPSLKDPTAAQPYVNPKQKTTYTLTLSYAGENEYNQVTSDEVDVYILKKVEFKEHRDQKYGFDDGAYTGPSAGKKWKSVEFDNFDRFDLKIDPVESAKFVYLKSQNKNIAIVAPLVAAISPQRLDIYGASTSETSKQDRETEIVAYCKNPEGEIKLDEIGIVVYKYKIKTTSLTLVHEENDDVQLIEWGMGLPNMVAIEAGPDGILQSKAVLGGASFSRDGGPGDDEVVGKTITTGKDGICQTETLADDIPKIKPFKGKPNALCIIPGNNERSDTKMFNYNLLFLNGRKKINGDDDYIEPYFGGIGTGENGICETKANGNNQIASNYDKAKISKFLNDTYKSGLVKWVLSDEDFSTTANFDFNLDGKIDLTHTIFGTGGKEFGFFFTLFNKGPRSSFDHNIFFVNNIFTHESPEIAGIAIYAAGYPNQAFVDATKLILEGDALKTVEWTVAHELGHCLGLHHPKVITCDIGDNIFDLLSNFFDYTNLLDNCGLSKLRKFQWDKIQGVQF